MEVIPDGVVDEPDKGGKLTVLNIGLRAHQNEWHPHLF